MLPELYFEMIIVEDALEGTELKKGDVCAFKEKAVAVFKVGDVGGLD